ncbi:hypothetical protein P2H44_14685 [Albimonas sp. CAU 1670]|uniref:hypothetical protein n=1 Tax=Albimonas sp. CAU 1670 TaxID=3032599 RepID=UPI0023DB9B77|nr:hypothetical protein [Albimonas sp. CAU 1670]MDF2233804.1 hypothetical protein [Albimonas sp. CAU 1670]
MRRDPAAGVPARAVGAFPGGGAILFAAWYRLAPAGPVEDRQVIVLDQAASTT